MKARLDSFRLIALVLALALIGGTVGCGDSSVAPAAEANESAAAEVAATADLAPTATTPPTSTPTVAPPTSTPTATPTITPSPTPRPGLPLQLRIPAIGVKTLIEHVGLTEDLAMDVPSEVENVAWYKLGYRPGEQGNAVLAGHLDTVTGAPAVFWDLESLQQGDEIFVVGVDGVERRFAVDYHTWYPYDEAPVQEIFGPAPDSRLVLITCNGEWNRAERNYSHRVVLYATAVEEEAGVTGDP